MKVSVICRGEFLWFVLIPFAVALRPQQPFMPLVGDVPSQPNVRPSPSQPRFAVAAGALAIYYSGSQGSPEF